MERGETFRNGALLFLVSQGRVLLERDDLWEGEGSGSVIGRVVGVWRKL